MFLLVFCLANIYRPSLGKVRFGRPNPNLSQSLNIYLRRKKTHSTQNCMHYNVSSSNFHFHLFKKNYFEKFIIKPIKMFNYIYNKSMYCDWCLVMNNDFKTNARSNYICKFEVSDWFWQGILFRDVFFLFLSSYFSIDDGIHSAEKSCY